MADREQMDDQWFFNYADDYPRVQSLAYMAEHDAHASMYRDLLVSVEKENERLREELHRERERRAGAEADRRRMLQLVVAYMTTTTFEDRRDEDVFQMRAKVSKMLLAHARDPMVVIRATLTKIAEQADAALASPSTGGLPHA